MKKLLSFACATVIGATTILGTSCKDENKCATVACGVGVCKDGTCECPIGYSGPNCSTVWATKYIGFWQTDHFLEDEIMFGAEPKIFFKASSNLATLLIDDFIFDEFDNVIVDLTSINSFKFRENQELEENTILLSGSGTIDELGIKITGSYQVKETNSLGEEKILNLKFDSEKQ